MTIKAILFDLDGTLIDSNEQHVAAWAEVFRRSGHAVEPGAIHDQIGKGADLLVPALIPGASEEMADALGKLHGKIFKADFRGKVRPFADAHELLVRVRKSGRDIVFASSASNDDLDVYLDLLGAHHLVSATTSIDDVQTSKPAPDIFAVALEKSGCSARQALAVGDSPYDVESAGKSDIASVALRSGKFSDEALLQAGAKSLYDDAAALLRHFDDWT